MIKKKLANNYCLFIHIYIYRSSCQILLHQYISHYCIQISAQNWFIYHPTYLLLTIKNGKKTTKKNFDCIPKKKISVCLEKQKITYKKYKKKNKQKITPTYPPP